MMTVLMDGNHPALRDELKRFIVRRLRLEHVDPETIEDDAPLAGGGLDLDSIDLLELVVGLEKEYGLKVPDAAEGRRALASVTSLAAYIAAQRGPS
ncbi:MAG TPA: phosphopantetheine-binding protein [Candidatus Polarisedimenticolia bacterium]|nr:phosphopantetheine-binding protein [Candidatus Polarisedimenticolia bacterium]